MKLKAMSKCHIWLQLLQILGSTFALLQVEYDTFDGPDLNIYINEKLENVNAIGKWLRSHCEFVSYQESFVACEGNDST